MGACVQFYRKLSQALLEDLLLLLLREKLCVSNFPHDPLIGINITEAYIIKITSSSHNQ